VRWLLASGGASITEADANGRKAVHYACAYKRRGEIDNVEHSVREQGLLQYLLSAEAMLLADRDSSGHTPLMIAARIGNLGLLRWLHTSWGADVVSQEDDEGMSVMHHAVISGYVEALAHF
jgi:ankyrin repeat protein